MHINKCPGDKEIDTPHTSGPRRAFLSTKPGPLRNTCLAVFGRKPGAPLELTLSVRAREAPGSIAGILNNLGRCHDNTGQHARTRPLFEQARAAAAAAGDTVGVGNACLNLGLCHVEMGQRAQALPMYEQARAAFAVRPVRRVHGRRFHGRRLVNIVRKFVCRGLEILWTHGRFG